MRLWLNRSSSSATVVALFANIGYIICAKRNQRSVTATVSLTFSSIIATVSLTFGSVVNNFDFKFPPAFLIGMAFTNGDSASSNSMAATSSSQNQGSTFTMRGCGRAKNNKLRLYTQLMGGKPTIVIPPDLTQLVGHNLHMFKAELGIICRCYAPIAAATWKEMEDFQNTTLRLRLEDIFGNYNCLLPSVL
ncbi:hypothetical protein F0562_025885 [Nyssa sinensis]|uniref:Uncharacterized protein n=1 Tax=Nyssa sinensis TaxID=561372 RepID=A0A5J5B7J4_9ASTE|nr:hypothetical protein F0562_025885 [Nyssa sinensis]